LSSKQAIAADDGIKRERLMDEAILARIHPQELALMKKHNLIYCKKDLGNQGLCGNVRLNIQRIE
jgi:hypothetical protein